MRQLYLSQFNIKKGKAIIILILVISFTFAFTALGLLLKLVDTQLIKILLNCIIYLIIGFPALVAYKIQGGKIKELFIKGNKKQYLLAFAIFFVLSVTVALVPALLGNSIIGDSLAFDIETLILYAVFFILFVGPIEEFIFRIYIQETLENVFEKHKWFAPLLSSLIFGLWHFTNGSLMQVIFTFLIGLVFAFSRYYFKNCTYVSLALAHGFYDFFNIVIRMFIV